MASVSVQGWIILVDGNGLLTFLLKSWSSLTSTFTSAKLYLWPVVEVCSVTAELGCLPLVCSLTLTPNVLAVSPMYSFSHLPHFSVHYPTLFLFLSPILGAYQQGPQSVE